MRKIFARDPYATVLDLDHQPVISILSDRDPNQIDRGVADREGVSGIDEEIDEDLGEAFAGHFEDHESLTDEEIDDLCERLNFAGDQVVKGAAY